MAKRPARSQSGYTFAALVADYEREGTGMRRLHDYDKARLLRAFSHRRLSDLTDERITAYGLSREDRGAHPVVINEELRTLGDLLVWARDVAKKLDRIPRIQRMREAPEPPRHIDIRPSPFLRDFFPMRGSLLADASRPPAKLARRPRSERWSDAGVSEHLKQHPIDKRNRDGTRFSDQQRADAIEKEQGIKIDRTTVARRLRQFRPPA